MWTSSLRITWELMRNRKSQVSPQTSTPGKRTVTYDSTNLGHLGIEICWVYKQLKKEVCDNYFSTAVIKKIKSNIWKKFVLVDGSEETRVHHGGDMAAYSRKMRGHISATNMKQTE